MRFPINQLKDIPPHKWFAWYPVRVTKLVDGFRTDSHYAWFEYVERSMKVVQESGPDWRYQAFTDDTPNDIHYPNSNRGMIACLAVLGGVGVALGSLCALVIKCIMWNLSH